LPLVLGLVLPVIVGLAIAGTMVMMADG